MIVCTLCSCYPWEVLGLPPVWYKSAPYRSRAVKDPRGVLADFGVTLPKETEIRVWDSTAETRFLVLPMRPAGTEGWSEERLAELVTRDSMIGTGLPEAPSGGRLMNGVHDMGGMDGFGKVEPEPNEPPFHATWEGRVSAMQRAMGYAGAWHIDMARYAQETLAAARSISPSSYYQRWALAMEKNLLSSAASSAEDELAAGHALRPGKTLPRKLTPDVVDARHDAQLVLPPAAGPGALQAGRPRARRRTSTRRRTPACRATRAARSAWSSWCTAATSSRTRSRIGARRRSAVALHGRVRRPRALGRRMPIRRSRSRSMPSSPISNRHDGSAPTARRPSRASRSDAEGPVFREPWEAQAFAMALALHERGLFTWPEWAATLGRRDQAGAGGGRSRYRRDLLPPLAQALERLVAEKGVADAGDLARYQRRLGSRRRPHAARRADRAQAGRFQVDGVFRHFGRSRTDSQSPATTLFSRDGGRSANERCRLEELQGRRVGHRLGTRQLQRAMGRRQGVWRWRRVLAKHTTGSR